MKTPAILLGLILLSSFVCAANVTLTPASVYETTSVWEALDVNNHRGSSVITRVTMSSPLPVVDAVNYSGWSKTQTQYSAEWDDGTIETNMQSALFEFKISAPSVANDTAVTFNVSLDSSTTALTLAILNDATPPVIANVRPFMYARANSAMHPISVTAVDAETSVDSVVYSYSDCIGVSVPVSLVQSGDTYNGVANFSDFDEGEKACYVVRATNKPGETGNVSGELLFDGTPPVVNISAPTSYATESTDFVFTAFDNIASVLACTVYLDATELVTVNATNNTLTTVNQNLSGFDQGSHTWSVTCQDGVGLSSTHAQVIVLDTASPVISLDAASTVPRTQNLEFVATVTDTVSLATVNAVFDGNNVTLTRDGDRYRGVVSSDVLGAKNLVITASDNAGHVSTSTKAVAIVPNHRVSLSLSPGTVAPGGSVTASGSVTPEGNVSVDAVIVKTPAGDFTVDLVDGDFTKTFTAPDSGTYVVSVEFVDSGHTYRASATLTVGISSSSNTGSGSDGYDREWSGGAGYVKPKEETVSEGTSQNSELVTEPEPVPEPAPYVPLQQLPEPEREAFVPKTTGVFTLGSTVKWLALLLALAVIAGLGAYAYSKRRPKDDSGIDWDGYFKNNGA